MQVTQITVVRYVKPYSFFRNVSKATGGSLIRVNDRPYVRPSGM
jgi:hypothetical protein